MTVNQVLALLAALTLVFTFADVLINRNCFTDLKMNVKLERHLYLENLEIPGSLFRQNQMAGNPSMPVYQWNGTFSESDVCNHPEAINRNRLYFYGYYPMFLYSKFQDRLVSGLIINTGEWKPILSKAILDVLARNHDMLFIDIGGGLGMLSLDVRKKGFDVLLVDPSVSNVQRFCASVKLNGVLDSVSIVLNPLSSRHEHVQMVAEDDRISEWFVADNNPLKVAQTNSSRYITKDNVKAATLDDLLYLPELNSDRDLVLHLDTAGYDLHILRGGESFFEIKRIKAIFMDWTYNSDSEYNGDIIKFMMVREFRPFDLNFRISLIEKPQSQWPDTLVWMHGSYKT